MELKSIIEECAKRKIQLWIENGKLHFRSPVGVFDEKLKQNIKVNYCIGMENPYNYRNKGK